MCTQAHRFQHVIRPGSVEVMRERERKKHAMNDNNKKIYRNGNVCSISSEMEEIEEKERDRKRNEFCGYASIPIDY